MITNNHDPRQGGGLFGERKRWKHRQPWPVTTF